jgi:hypothetical protein
MIMYVTNNDDVQFLFQNRPRMQGMNNHVIYSDSCRPVVYMLLKMYYDLFNIIYIFVFHFISIFIVCSIFENMYLFNKISFNRGNIF